MQPLRLLLLALLACAMAMPIAPAAAADGRLACAVCEAIVDEVNSGIASTKVQHSVQTRFRIDEKKRIPYARTEHNLLEIMEGDSFLRRFEAYAVVAPQSDSADYLRRAYKAVLEGREIEPVVKQIKKAKAPKPAAPEAPKEEPVKAGEEKSAEAAAAATDASVAPAEGEQAAATPEAAAAADSTPAPPAPEAEKQEAAQEEEEGEFETKTYAPFPARLPEPMSLSLSQHVLVRRSEAEQAGLETESDSPRVKAEIRAAVARFLDDNLDEAVLLFHRDVPELKRKLCVEITESCVPRKEAKKKKGKKRKGKKAPPKKKPAPKKEEQKEEPVPAQQQEAQQPAEVKSKEEL